MSERLKEHEKTSLRAKYLTPFERKEFKKLNDEDCETMWTSSESIDQEGNLLEHVIIH
tara:strand:- start:432 stop:605 length:174 start_codon:yes stop_codon:yes gene_type:complete